ncbi:hypothetical protein RBSH_02815 [Rhodopirellula baltica SH28]|uniref:Uncharacterized protein n=1 Tax=Rhodopirellula baltica SH28 TaxID=993517 RepID=K5D5B8_RHOBT|nr:hypothetical protein RBSH_02815 [Rhodopirellula baltica SH28]
MIAARDQLKTLAKLLRYTRAACLLREYGIHRPTELHAANHC